MVQRIEKMITLQDGSIVYEFNLNGFVGHYLLPMSDMQYNLINYGFTAPAFVVFPDKAVELEEVYDYVNQYQLDEICRKQGTGILVMNPHTTWEDEVDGAYEAAATNFGIAQSNFRDGLAIMERPGCSDERSYAMLGSCVRMYVYALGRGADYILKTALKTIKGQTSLGDLGFADSTMTCCTLVDATYTGEIEKSDIIVVSVNNSEQLNEKLKKSCREVVCENRIDFKADFLGAAGGYRRWAGRIMKAYNYEAEGIAALPGSCMVPVSDDNEIFTSRFGPFGPKEHKVGYVIFYDKDLDIQNGKSPLLLVFHGGGDCALATASLAEWPEIGQKEGFITVAVEMHLKVSAREVVSLIDHLCANYSIDRERIYATGFSMGSIKSWDLFEQCPSYFAAIAPMDAINDPGANCFGGQTAAERINKDVLVPMFYVGGVSSPLPELPKQNARAITKLQYLSSVNQLTQKFNIDFEKKEQWEDPDLGVKGDEVVELHDDLYPESVYSLHSFRSENGEIYTKILSISNHGHEIRPFTNQLAWDFLKQFRRNEQGEIEFI